MKHLVSVVIATYRRDESLKKALLSLSEQTYNNIEILLIDDNDDPVWNEKVSQIKNEFSAQFPNIDCSLIVNHPNLGSAKARNVGIFAAKGSYITFLDDDDIYLPEKIEVQLAAMVKENADYGFTDLYLYNENEKLTDKRVRSYIKQTDPSALQVYHLMYHMTGTDTFMFNSQYLNSIGGFEAIDVGDEFYLMQKAIKGGGKFCYLPRCDVKAYVHTENNGLSSGTQKADGENQLYAYKKQFFGSLTAKQKRYIKVRHYAVLAFAGLHQRNLGDFLVNAIKAGFVSPLISFKILLNR